MIQLSKYFRIPKIIPDKNIEQSRLRILHFIFMTDKLKNKTKTTLFRNRLTQLTSTYLGRLVFGSLTRQKAYMILLLFKSSASSSMPPSIQRNIFL